MNKPEYEGYCAFAVSLGKKDVKGNANIFLVQGDRKFLFSNSVAKFLWRIFPARITKADSNWSKS